MLRCPGLPAWLQIWPTWSLANSSTKQPHSSHHALLYTEAQSGVNQLSPPGGADVCTKSRNVGKGKRLHQKHLLGATREMGSSREDQRRPVSLLSYWSLCGDTLAVLTDSSLGGEEAWEPQNLCPLQLRLYHTVYGRVSFSGPLP